MPDQTQCEACATALGGQKQADLAWFKQGVRGWHDFPQGISTAHPGLTILQVRIHNGLPRAVRLSLNGNDWCHLNRQNIIFPGLRPNKAVVEFVAGGFMSLGGGRRVNFKFGGTIEKKNFRLDVNDATGKHLEILREQVKMLDSAIIPEAFPWCFAPDLAILPGKVFSALNKGLASLDNIPRSGNIIFADEISSGNSAPHVGNTVSH